jgi:hypothetical protein
MLKPITVNKAALLCFLALFSIISGNCFSKQNFADLNKNSFYSSKKVKKYFSLGGGYKSDYNSREFEILSGYKYKSNKLIHEVDFLHEVKESSTTKKEIRKTEELYDFEGSTRALIGQSAYYANIYNRIQYDELSKFYYDVSSAAGLGRLFYKGKFESSINLGYNDVKNFNSEVIILGIIKGYFTISDNIKLSTRGSLTRAEKEYDEEIKNVLSFKIQRNLSFELIHRYEKNRYTKTSKKLGTYRVNRVKREAYARFKYNF